jgi:uncharacterized protein (DUF1697 family)
MMKELKNIAVNNGCKNVIIIWSGNLNQMGFQTPPDS